MASANIGTIRATILAFAAIGALAISALLFANTLAIQTAEVHSVAGILA